MNSTGFLVVDSELRPVYTNPEAARILLYPENAFHPGPYRQLFADKICTFLPDGFQDPQNSIPQNSIPRNSIVTHFQSGRRRYYCRAFV